MPEAAPACPACAHPMRPSSGEGDPTWLCDECGNFFMPRKQFQKLTGVTIAGRTVPSSPEEHRPCPGCRGPTAGIEVRGADIELCPRCDIVITDRASFSFIVDHTPGRPELSSLRLGLDVSRNLSNATRAGTIPKLQLENLFVLYRNGILITSYTPKIPVGLDRDILGSMLMAVTGFVQASFRGMAEDHPLSSIRFGEREIAFEHGDFLVLAMTLKGSLDPAVRRGLSAALKKVETQNDHILRSWDGDIGNLGGLLGAFEQLLAPASASG